jgi:integrase
MIPSSNKGRGKHARLPSPVRIGSDITALLASACRRRKSTDLLFKRWGYKRADGIKWEKDALRGWLPSELTDPFKMVAERAGLSEEVTAYALRHSSIARGLRAGLPVRLVAAIHDTSSEMIEKYYSAFIVDAFDAIAVGAIVPLV